MAAGPLVPPNLVRVTVSSATRSTDLVLPGAVEVADLLPELARRVGILDRTRACAGYRAVTRSGVVLRHDLGLAAQGVAHGDVLTIIAAPDEPPERYDDPVEAMAVVAEHETPPWSAATARNVTLGCAAALLLGGAAALAGGHATAGASRSAALSWAVSIALVLAAAGLSRSRPVTAAVTMAHLACLYAAVAAVCHGLSMSGTTVAEAGIAALGVGLVAAWGLHEGRMLMLPAVVLGGVGAAIGLLERATSVSPAVWATVALAAVVISGGWFPGWALGASGAGRHVLAMPTSSAHSAVLPVDLAWLRADAGLARELLVAMAAAAGALLVVLAPVAVAAGPAGFAVPALGSVVVILRTRRYRASTEVLVGVGSGALGLASTLLSLVWLRPEWRFALGVVVAGCGLVLLAQVLRPRRGDARVGRLGDRVEATALVLLPVMVLATGLSFEGR